MIPTVESYLYIRHLWREGQSITGFPKGWAEAWVSYCVNHNMQEPCFETWKRGIAQ